MKVLVTGAAGKTGRWVVRELVGDGAAHSVVAFDRVSPEPLPGVQGLAGDHTSFAQVMGAMEGADVVIHLSAVPRPGVVTSDVTFRTNIEGAFNVHEAARLLKVRRVITMSSEAALGWTYAERPFTPDYLPIDERHPLRPHDSYSLSKQVAEAIAASYFARGAFEGLALRPTWIIDPDELEGLRRNGGRGSTAFLPHNYIDVRDVARACRLAIECRLEGYEAVYLIADDSGVAEPLAELYPRARPDIGDMAAGLTGSRPSVSNARAKALLGWEPRFSWRRGDPE